MSIFPYPIKLKDKEQLTPDAFNFTFTKPVDFDFQAGQYTEMSFSPTLTRCYSLASAPQDPDLHFLIKLIPQGAASEFLRHLTIGETVLISEAKGNWITSTSSQNLTFVVTGTGIAPARSIIRDQLLFQASTAPINLLAGFRQETDIIARAEWEELQQQFPNLRCLFSLSQPNEQWFGPTGYITDHLDNIGTDSCFFLCGLPAMATTAIQKIMAQGVSPLKIRTEVY